MPDVDAPLEMVARAIRDAYEKHAGGDLTPWDKVPPPRRVKWYDMAIAARQALRGDTSFKSGAIRPSLGD